MIDSGGRFYVFTYCYSLIVVTYKKPSKVFFVRAGESLISESLSYLLLSIVMGWWGIPWGPIYTIQSIYNAFNGIDVTESACQDLNLTMPNAVFQRGNMAQQLNTAPSQQTRQETVASKPSVAKFCRFCGFKLPTGTFTFCPNCGSRLD